MSSTGPYSRDAKLRPHLGPLADELIDRGKLQHNVDSGSSGLWE